MITIHVFLGGGDLVEHSCKEEGAYSQYYRVDGWGMTAGEYDVKINYCPFCGVNLDSLIDKYLLNQLDAKMVFPYSKYLKKACLHVFGDEVGNTKFNNLDLYTIYTNKDSLNTVLEELNLTWKSIINKEYLWE